MDKPVLVILTNAHMLGHGSETTSSLASPSNMMHRTGFDIKTVAHIWNCWNTKMNNKVVFVTPRGGEAPIDPRSMQEAEKDKELQDSLRDHSFLGMFKNTQSLDKIRPEDYSWIMFPGSHGAMMDLPNCNKLQDIVMRMEENKGCMAAIGHGVAGFMNVKKKNGEYWLKGRRVTCFTNEEEHERKLDKMLPYLLEDKIKERGAHLQKTKPFEPLVVMDENLITAQNTTSVTAWIEKIMEHHRKGQLRN